MNAAERAFREAFAADGAYRIASMVFAHAPGLSVKWRRCGDEVRMTLPQRLRGAPPSVAGEIAGYVRWRMGLDGPGRVFGGFSEEAREWIRANGGSGE